MVFGKKKKEPEDLAKETKTQEAQINPKKETKPVDFATMSMDQFKAWQENELKTQEQYNKDKSDQEIKDHGYSTDGELLAVLIEIRDMLRDLHNIEVAKSSLITKTPAP